MRGSDKRCGELFSYVDLEQRVRAEWRFTCHGHLSNLSEPDEENKLTHRNTRAVWVNTSCAECVYL